MKKRVRWCVWLAMVLAGCCGEASANIPDTERNALIALYNSTGGAGWYDSTDWLGPAGTEGTWKGVWVVNDHVNGIILTNNNMSGKLPPELGNLTNLLSISLYANQLTGHIPLELGNLVNLLSLYLYDNYLTGTIPASLGDLAKLQNLRLGSNWLTGPIPAQLGNLSNLQVLSLSDNALSGTIPVELGNLTNLQTLDIYYNNLTGTIPTQLQNLTKLQYLMLNHNNLTGTIPNQLGNMTQLLMLSLDQNQLTGNIPVQLGNLTNLFSFQLDHNQLTGAIPSQLGNLINLSYFGLNNNQLSGIIPNQLGNLSKLLYFSLNNNQLTGEVPPSFINLTSLNNSTGLNLRDNHLQCTNPALVSFVNDKDGSDWLSTQTLLLNASKTGTGSGQINSDVSGITCGSNCSAYFAYDIVVTLTATPDGKSKFIGWNGACSGIGPCQVTMDAAKSATATFVDSDSTPFMLLVSKTGPGDGTVTSSPDGIYCGSDCSEAYINGTFVTLTATPDNGSKFMGWSGACTGTGACQISMDAAKSVTATFSGSTTLFVPIVVSSSGINYSFFTSELTLTNRGTGNATLNYAFIDALGDSAANGRAADTLLPGQQKIVPDAIAYLSSLGVPIPLVGNQGGTLRVSVEGLASGLEGGATVRTTTAVPNGRAGLAFAGIPISKGLNGPAYLCGLRQTPADRSNVAVQNMGTSSDGNIVLRLTLYSGDPANSVTHVLADKVLAPGNFFQFSGILSSDGLSLSNGYVRIERISGIAPYYAYGVINDNANSDGSFIPPILESSLTGKTSMTLPVIVETSTFTSELALTNWTATDKTLQCSYVASAITTANQTASFTIQLNAGEQKIIPNFVQSLRTQGVTGIGPAGSTFAGALYVSIATTGDLSGISVAARTSTPGGGGEYGLYYTAMPAGNSSTTDAWIYGLQQNSENRTNLALVNTGETDNSADTFQINLYDGTTGAQVGSVPPITLNPFAWTQIGTIISTYASGTTAGYAHITRKSGNNPFIAYAVINDGATPGQRSGDGTFIASTP